MFKRIILFILVILLLLSQTALAKKYEYRKTYIGENEHYNYYVYNDDVFFIMNFTTFPEIGNWALQIIQEPKSEYVRKFLISLLEESRRTDPANIILLSPKDNKLWAFSAWLIYDAKKNQLFVKDSYWLNQDCDDIAVINSDRVEAHPDYWKVKEMVNAHLRAKYAEQGKVVR